MTGFANFTSPKAGKSSESLMSEMRAALEEFQAIEPELSREGKFLQAVAKGAQVFAHPDTVREMADLVPGAKPNSLLEPGFMYAVDLSLAFKSFADLMERDDDPTT